MNIGIIDADLIGRKRHRFPNLVCEKISAYYKEKGNNVTLLFNYDQLDDYDEVFISKVFTDTPVPDWLTETSKIHLGGTGFYFDHAPSLPEEIEHHMPDYHLYDEWIKQQETEWKQEAEQKGKKFNKSTFHSEFKMYTDYSIGFLTRGCFRKCEFCVNKKYNKVFKHSPLDEFYDPSRKKICLLDDNFFGCPNWKELLLELQKTNKPFVFKQGLDERLLTEEKCQMLFSSKYDGDYIFAFDNIKDFDLIHEKLKLIRKYSSSLHIMFYVLTGFESTDKTDIENTFKRISLLLQYGCIPYLMRFQNQNEKPYLNSEFKDLYIAMARWCNQPSVLKRMTFREFCYNQQSTRKNVICPALRSLQYVEENYPDIAEKYFDIRFNSSFRREVETYDHR